MIYILALITCVVIGYLSLRLISDRFSFHLSLLLGAALGLGIVSQIIFYLQLLGGNFNHLLPPAVSLAFLGILIWTHKSLKIPPAKASKNSSLLVLLALSVALWLEANYYPMGGWDAWSCWNLKAKFIYLGENSWKDIFLPILWRSNTGYPLALPSLNVWFWQWSGFSEYVPMLNAIILTLLTSGILLLSLQEFKVPSRISIIITLAIFTLSFGNTLCVSQYSDILFSLYLLCAFVCYIHYFNLKDKRLLILTGIFIGLLSFTKNEGLAAAGILFLLILCQKLSKPWPFIVALIIACLPTIIFTLTMAPHHDAFVNGLTSAEKPSSFTRLLFILASSLMGFISFKWMGLWIIALWGLIIGRQKAFSAPLAIIGIFVACYLAVVIAYYQINTFFEISWWIKNTFDRIIFVLMPSVFLWMGLSNFKTDA